MNLPRTTIGYIMLFCPEELHKCIRFIRIWPRAIEIIWRPKFIQRRDMDALLLRGRPSDISDCIKFKWVDGYVALCEKCCYASEESVIKAMKLGLNVEKTRLENVESLLAFYEPLENFIKLKPNGRILLEFLVPAETARYWIIKYAAEHSKSFIYEICIVQNHWDLADNYFTRHSYSTLVTFSKTKLRKYIEYSLERNRGGTFTYNELAATSGVKKYHLDVFLEYFPNGYRPQVTLSHYFKGYRAANTVSAKSLSFSKYKPDITEFNKRGLIHHLRKFPPDERVIADLVDAGRFEFVFLKPYSD